MLFVGQWVKHGFQRGGKLVDVRRLKLQGSLAALNAGHFQHIVNEGEQEIAGRTYFSQIIQRTIPLVQVGCQ